MQTELKPETCVIGFHEPENISFVPSQFGWLQDWMEVVQILLTPIEPFCVPFQKEVEDGEWGWVKVSAGECGGVRWSEGE